MSKAIKAALLSALVFPGIGHFSLKKPLQGTLLSGASVACLYFLVSAIMEIVRPLINKAVNGELPMDVAKLNAIVSHQLAGNDGKLIHIASLMLVIFWVVGIVDSLRLGWKQKQTDGVADQQI